MIIDRISERAKIKRNDEKNTYISTYEVIEKITNEMVINEKDLINDVTLKNIPEYALESKIVNIINKHNYKVENKNRIELLKDVKDNIFGYGLAEKYLRIKDCNGFFINGPDNVWVQIGKYRERIDESFGNPKNVESFIRSISAKLGGEINENKPLAKFYDKDRKLRIVACIDPVSHISPTVVFRKHRDENFTMEDLIDLGMLSKELAHDLINYNIAGANIIIAGKGGSGKTTLARALTEVLPKETRILTMEEQPEFFLKHPGALQRIVKRNDKGHITGLAELTDMGLLETIDRYIFGEIRGSEALYLFKGALSGNVTMSTTHSSGSEDVVDMLSINMQMSGTEIPDHTLKHILYKSINIIIYMDSFVVKDVVEVVNESDNKYNKIWSFDVTEKHTTFIEGEHKKIGNIKSKEMKNKLKIHNEGYLKCIGL